MDVPSASPKLKQPPQSTALPRKALRRFVRINRLVPGARVLLVGSTDGALAEQLSRLHIEAICVETLDQFNEPNVELVVDCLCHFGNADLQTQEQWQQTADLLSNVRGNGSLCFVFPRDPALTVTSLHKHLVPFTESSEKPTGRDTDQIRIEIVKKPFFSRHPAWCLAAMQVPSAAPDAATWHRRAVEAANQTKAKRSAA